MEDSTLKLFCKYVVNQSHGEVDASGIFSLNCYMEWLAMKRSIPKRPAEAFRKAVTGHCRGDNGLHPFSEKVEQAVLHILRQKKVWDCFVGSGIKIGLRGFQTEGFWERKNKSKTQSVFDAQEEPQPQPHLKRTSALNTQNFLTKRKFEQISMFQSDFDFGFESKFESPLKKPIFHSLMTIPEINYNVVKEESSDCSSSSTTTTDCCTESDFLTDEEVCDLLELDGVQPQECGQIVPMESQQSFILTSMPSLLGFDSFLLAN